MPVAPYGTEKYRTWNRERMRRVRSLGISWGKWNRRHYSAQQVRRERGARRAILALAGLEEET
jgi:hypothetical protein